MSAAGDRLLSDIQARTIGLERNQSKLTSAINSLNKTIGRQSGSSRRLSGSTRDEDRPIPPSIQTGQDSRSVKKEMKEFFKGMTGKRALGWGTGLGLLAIFGDLLDPNAMLRDIGSGVVDRAKKIKDAVKDLIFNKMNDYLKAATDMITGVDTPDTASHADERKQLEKLIDLQKFGVDMLWKTVTKSFDNVKKHFEENINTPENRKRVEDWTKKQADELKKQALDEGKKVIDQVNEDYVQPALESAGDAATDTIDMLRPHPSPENYRRREEFKEDIREGLKDAWDWLRDLDLGANAAGNASGPQTAGTPQGSSKPEGFNDPGNRPPRESIISQKQLDVAGDTASVALQQTSSTMWQKAMDPVAKSIEKAMEKSPVLTGGIKWSELMRLGPFKAYGAMGKAAQGALSIGSRVGVRAVPFVGQGVMAHDVLSSGVNIFDSMAEQSINVGTNDPGGTKRKLKWAKGRLNDNEYALYKRFVDAQQTRKRLGWLGDPAQERSAWTGEPALWLIRALSGQKNPVRTNYEQMELTDAENFMRKNRPEFDKIKAAMGKAEAKSNEVQNFSDEQLQIKLRNKAERENKKQPPGAAAGQGVNLNQTTNNFLNKTGPEPADMFSEVFTLKNWTNN
jgi:hypothetical protein